MAASQCRFNSTVCGGKMRLLDSDPHLDATHSPNPKHTIANGICHPPNTPCNPPPLPPSHPHRCTPLIRPFLSAKHPIFLSHFALERAGKAIAVSTVSADTFHCIQGGGGGGGLMGNLAQCRPLNLTEINRPPADGNRATLPSQWLLSISGAVRLYVCMDESIGAQQ